MKAIKEINKIILMLLNHANGVVNALMSNMNKAMAERLNGKIQEIKLFGRGDQLFENFSSVSQYFHGGLDL